MKGFLLDTNVPSELIRSRPDPRVRDWVRKQPDEAMFLSVISVGELRRGLSYFQLGHDATVLEHWFEHDLMVWLDQRVLSVTKVIADGWGGLAGECQLRGVSLSTADGLIAATALEHNLILATRNVKDFAGLGVTLENPWVAA